MKKRRPPKKTAKRNVRAPGLAPELAEWQLRSLDALERSPLGPELVFGGGAALASVYLHHRFSEDLDFFLKREPSATELSTISRSLRSPGSSVDLRVAGPVRSLILGRDGEEYGKIDFAVSTHPRAEEPLAWRLLRVESLRDMTINKVQTVLTRFQARDFVDLYFLLQEGPERRLGKLLDLVRSKFDLGADRFTLAERLVAVREIRELPRMIRPIDLETLRAFFWDRARELIREG